jgi:hypothetical protein
VAEGEGFEPPEACTSAVFKTAAIVRSATPPRFANSSEGGAQRCLTTTVPAIRSCQPRRRLSMKIQMKPRYKTKPDTQ